MENAREMEIDQLRPLRKREEMEYTAYGCCCLTVVGTVEPKGRTVPLAGPAEWSGQ